MIVSKPTHETTRRGSVVRMIATGTAAALVVSLATVIVSQLLGHPAHPGLAATMAAVAAASCAAGHGESR